jgi:hypothetical protein
MADRYQNRSFPADNGYDAESHSSGESDPLAELARLIGQTDPFGTRPMGRANLQAQPAARPADPGPSYGHYADDPEPYEASPPAPPSWIQRAAVRQEASPPPVPPDDYPSTVHPLHRYAAAPPPAEPDYAAEPEYDSGQFYADPVHAADPSRYDEALYGSFEPAPQPTQYDQGYADNSYAYEEDEHLVAPEPRRRGGMITVAAVLALAVFGVGGAFAYRNYTGVTRSGDPPIIRADAGPTKIIPAPADVAAKVPDRMTPGDGTEKIVSREETPIDPSARSGTRVVFPPLTPNGSAPLPTSIVPGAPPATTSAANGTFANNEPHAVHTVPVRGDQTSSGTPAGATPPAPAPVAAAPVKPPRTTNARTQASNPSAANPNGPLSLAPQAEAQAAPEPPSVRVAANSPTEAVPSVPATPSAGSGYLVSVTSQPTEAEAQASYRSLQGKYPSVLGSQSAVVARANSKSGAVTYRAGPSFGNQAEAAQFCHSYQAAGGQCWVVKN